nr:transcriptional regulator PpsR [Plastoroseomonas arctica]
MGFAAPGKSLGDLDAESAATVIAAAADVTILLDGAGVIRDVAFGSEELAPSFEGWRSWIGRAWVDTVTEESRPKAEALLREAPKPSVPRWRHLNQSVPAGPAIPLLYASARVANQQRTVIFGRDLRPVSALQQRLVQAQQAMERDYARLRQAETRYRLLFQMSAEPVMVIDAVALRVVEANLAADRLFGADLASSTGRTFLEAFDAAGQPRVQAMLAGVRSAGQADDVLVRLADGEREVAVSAALLRQEKAALFLVRLAFPNAAGVSSLGPAGRSRLLEFVESAPDAFVVAKEDGTILSANPAFLEMAEIATEEQARGEPLSRFLGRHGFELDVLIANLRARGPVRLFETRLRGAHGAQSAVEVSAVIVVEGGPPCFGFTIRDVGKRLAPSQPAEALTMPRPVEQLTELVGRVPLKELVREATDVIERLAIEAALELSGDNRASAAEMLGLSRQSLYVKLRRYGLGDLDSQDEPS